MDRVRDIVFYKHYFTHFYEKQSEKLKNKIDYVLFLITVAERIPDKFFKHVEGTAGLYEIRIEYGGNIYRIFCCFDRGKLLVIFNGFQKKSQRTPHEEIDKALRLMKEYFDEKRERQ